MYGTYIHTYGSALCALYAEYTYRYNENDRKQILVVGVFFVSVCRQLLWPTATVKAFTLFAVMVPTAFAMFAVMMTTAFVLCGVRGDRDDDDTSYCREAVYPLVHAGCKRKIE